MSIMIESKMSKIFAINTRIPQRSPISPIFFLFFNAPFIKDCINSGLKVQVRGFVDDAHLIVYDTSTESNCHTLEQVYMICQK